MGWSLEGDGIELRVQIIATVREEKLSDELLAGSFQRLGILGDVRVLRPGVDLQLVHHMAGEFVLGHHPPNGVED